MDFATSVIWLAYNYISSLLVAGAVFSGFAMVNTLLIIMRKVSNLEAHYCSTHIDEYCNHDHRFYCRCCTLQNYLWHGIQVEYEQYVLTEQQDRIGGYWSMMTCNVFHHSSWFKNQEHIMFSFIIDSS
jgi:molybdopterin-containing oxidoreductase family membrane subunit